MPQVDGDGSVVPPRPDTKAVDPLIAPPGVYFHPERMKTWFTRNNANDLIPGGAPGDRASYPQAQGRFELQCTIQSTMPHREQYELRRLKVASMNDGEPCPLCGGPLYRNVPYKLPGGKRNPLYPSLDHIIPRSRGGENTWTNTRIVHLRCNQVRSDTGDEFLGDIERAAQLRHPSAHFGAHGDPPELIWAELQGRP